MAGLKIEGGDLVVSGSTLITGSAEFTGTLTVNGTSIPAGGGTSAFSNVVRTSLAGPSSGDTNFTQVLIPGGTFTSGDVLKLSALTKQDYTGGGTIYCNMGFSATSGSTGNNVGSWSATDRQAVMFEKQICIIAADGTGEGTVALQFGGNMDANNDGLDQFPDGPNGVSLNWNNDIYFMLNAFVDNASSNIETRYINLTKVSP